MKDILNTIGTLEGFMTSTEFSSSIFEAEAMGLDSSKAACYNGPEEPEIPGDLGEN